VLESEQTTAFGHRDPGHSPGEDPGRHWSRRPAPADSRTASDSLDIKEGDTVIFSKYAGTEDKLGADESWILSARDVIARRSSREVYAPQRMQSTPRRGPNVGPASGRRLIAEPQERESWPRSCVRHGGARALQRGVMEAR